MQADLADTESIDESSIEGWKPMKVDEAFEFTRKPRSLDIPEGEPIPFIPMDGISESNRKIDYAESRTLEEIKSGSFVFKDDLLVAKITPSFENGKQAILDNLSNEYGYATTEVWVLHPKEEVNILKEYLFYYLRRSKIRSDLAGKMEGSTGRQRLPKVVLRNLELHSPPLNEQEEIVSILNTVQDAIEQTEAVIQATRELKKSMMKHLFTYGSVPVDQTDQVELKETEIGQIPEDWEVVELQELANVKGGKRLPKGKDLVDKITNHPYLRVKDFKDGSIDKTELKYLTEDIFEEISRYTISKEDVFISIAGTIGVTGTIPSELDGANLTENAAKIMITDTAVLDKDYLKYFLSNPAAQHQIDIRTTKTSQPKLALTRLRQLPIQLPDIQTQIKISETLNSFESKINTELDKKTSLESLFNSLLENLMTANVRVI